MTLLTRSLIGPMALILLFSNGSAKAEDQECDYINNYVSEVETATVHNGGGVWRGASFSNDGDFWLLIERVPFAESVSYTHKAVDTVLLKDEQIALKFEGAVSVIIKDLAWAHDDFRQASNILSFALSYLGADGEKQQKVTARCEIKVEGDMIGDAICSPTQ